MRILLKMVWIHFQGIWKTYLSIIKRLDINHRVSSYALFENDFTDAHERHEILNLIDVHNNAVRNKQQLQIQTSLCLPSNFLENVEDIQLIGSA